jgi:hypothetical protein
MMGRQGSVLDIMTKRKRSHSHQGQLLDLATSNQMTMRKAIRLLSIIMLRLTNLLTLRSINIRTLQHAYVHRYRIYLRTLDQLRTLVE